MYSSLVSESTWLTASRELLYVSLSSLRLRANRTDTQQSLEVARAPSGDASVPSTKFPVMLAPRGVK